MIDRYAVEGALQRGQLWALMRNGRYWRVRRNGKTKLWKREPNRFEIPIKAGLRATGRIDQTATVAFTSQDNWRGQTFVVCATDPNL